METITLPDLIPNSGNIHNSIPVVDTNFPRSPRLVPSIHIDSMLDDCGAPLAAAKLNYALRPPPVKLRRGRLSLPWKRDGFGPALRGHLGHVGWFRAGREAAEDGRQSEQCGCQAHHRQHPGAGEERQWEGRG